MRRLQLLTFAVPLLSALACNDATAPGPAALQIRAPQHALVIPSTTPQVSAGDLHTCALKTDGTVVCWGDNEDGETTVPAGLTSVAQLSAGSIHTCALKTDGTVACWGYNFSGQATVPAGLASVSRVSGGGNDTCALKTDGTVVCWGLSNFGQATVPAGLTSVAQVSAGWYHTCALKATDGTVVCWGNNAWGQATVPDGLSSVAEVSAGYADTCALKTDGMVLCWGDNTYGQATVPADLASVEQVSAGGLYTCALKTDGTVVCWGLNNVGQATVPGGLTSVTQVSAGYDHTCALEADGTVVCWGENTYGQATVPAGLNLNSAPNYPPAVGAITAPVVPVQVNATITASASFTDPGTLDTHTAVFNWGDGTSSGATVTESGGSGSASGSHMYSTAGVYAITLTVSDNSGASGQSLFEFVVVYDPAAGFVTGDGSINSPAGAYAADPTLTGKAIFAFVSRYLKGATVPSGNTQFHFQAGNMKFKSASYDWLVIAGPQAKYKGSGTINGAGDFGFLLSAVDGAVSGGGGTDKFRIKIWDKSTGNVIYDNQSGATEDAAATTAIASGDILIYN
jgi:alpha-tubulin suppressor-like RCC1 family protein